MHGIALMVNHQWRRFKIVLPKSINWAMTFGSVMFLWIFFRANNFNDAWKIILKMSDFNLLAFPAGGKFESLLGGFDFNFVSWTINYPLGKTLIILSALFVIILKMKNPIVYTKNFKPTTKWTIITLTLALIALYKMNTYTEFLYFQF